MLRATTADGSTDAFERMFERDKETLRELGVPVVTVHGPAHGDDPGYRVDLDAYALPPMDLSAAQLAVLGLAAELWQDQTLRGGRDAGADQAPRRRCDALGDRRGRGARPAPACSRTFARTAPRCCTRPAGRRLHLPDREHGRGASQTRPAVADHRQRWRVVPRRLRLVARCGAGVPDEPDSRRRHGRRSAGCFPGSAGRRPAGDLRLRPSTARRASPGSQCARTVPVRYGPAPSIQTGIEPPVSGARRAETWLLFRTSAPRTSRTRSPGTRMP